MKKGLFIVVDGPSASGKDSIIRQVLKDLKKLNLNAISIEETKEANYDRKKILLAKQSGDKEVAKTIINERKKLYLEKVMPQLSKGTIVLANRGEPSTLSYQTLNELTMQDAWSMHRKQNIPLPDLVVIANCTVLEAIRREGLRKPSFEEKYKSFLSGKFTSLEKRKLIHANYKKTRDFLKKKGLSVIYLDTDKMNVREECKRIVSFIKNKVKLLHE
jgi:thymidylate kinase